MRWCLRTTPTVRNEMNKSQKAYKISTRSIENSSGSLSNSSDLQPRYNSLNWIYWLRSNWCNLTVLRSGITHKNLVSDRNLKQPLIMKRHRWQKRHHNARARQQLLCIMRNLAICKLALMHTYSRILGKGEDVISFPKQYRTIPNQLLINAVQLSI